MRTVCYGNRRKRHEIATDLWSQTKYTINGNREISLEGRPYESHGDDQLIRSLEAYGDSRPSPCPCDTKEPLNNRCSPDGLDLERFPGMSGPLVVC